MHIHTHTHTHKLTHSHTHTHIHTHTHTHHPLPHLHTHTHTHHTHTTSPSPPSLTLTLGVGDTLLLVRGEVQLDGAVDVGQGRLGDGLLERAGRVQRVLAGRLRVEERREPIPAPPLEGVLPGPRQRHALGGGHWVEADGGERVVPRQARVRRPLPRDPTTTTTTTVAAATTTDGGWERFDPPRAAAAASSTGGEVLSVQKAESGGRGESAAEHLRERAAAACRVYSVAAPVAGPVASSRLGQHGQRIPRGGPGARQSGDELASPQHVLLVGGEEGRLAVHAVAEAGHHDHQHQYARPQSHRGTPCCRCFSTGHATGLCSTSASSASRRPVTAWIMRASAPEDAEAGSWWCTDSLRYPKGAVRQSRKTDARALTSLRPKILLFVKVSGTGNEVSALELVDAMWRYWLKQSKNGRHPLRPCEGVRGEISKPWKYWWSGLHIRRLCEGTDEAVFTFEGSVKALMKPSSHSKVLWSGLHIRRLCEGTDEAVFTFVGAVKALMKQSSHSKAMWRHWWSGLHFRRLCEGNDEAVFTVEGSVKALMKRSSHSKALWRHWWRNLRSRTQSERSSRQKTLRSRWWRNLRARIHC